MLLLGAHNQDGRNLFERLVRRFVGYEASQWELDAWKREPCDQIAADTKKVLDVVEHHPGMNLASLLSAPF